MILRDTTRPILEIAPDVPTRLAQVVDRCLAKSPDDRFQTMRDMHTALNGLKHESDSGVLYRSAMTAPVEPAATPVPVSATNATPPSSNTTTWIISLAVALVLLGIGYVATRPAPSTPAPAETVQEAKPVAPAVPDDEEVLTNDGIIAMINAKLPTELIYSQIRNSPNEFNLSATEVIRLTAAKVPPPIIEAMRNPKNIPVSATILPATASAKLAPKAGEPAAPKAILDQASGIPAPTTPPTTPAPASTPAPREVVVNDGSPFVIGLTEDVPEDAKPGTQLHFTVVNDLKVNDAVVISKGATVLGEIAQGKRTFGKMTLRLTSVTAADGKAYKIRALSSRGDKNPERPVETSVKPKNNKVVADAGTQYIAYADGDMHVLIPARGK
jgi:serine/threonine-protein kinase